MNNLTNHHAGKNATRNQINALNKHIKENIFPHNQNITNVPNCAAGVLWILSGAGKLTNMIPKKNTFRQLESGS